MRAPAKWTGRDTSADARDTGATSAGTGSPLSLPLSLPIAPAAFSRIPLPNFVRHLRCQGTAMTRAIPSHSLEALELRRMLAAGARTIDGTLNNLASTVLGSAGQDLIRLAPAAYADGISQPAGSTRPSAREISNDFVAHGAD